ncbi:low temperature requirement protein A [Thermomonospora amylolytica]|uniref:low temperature requirement protein A n=1 Tax=Thermomonospora amylolytica TaxID=1411117 RepID=UPI000E6D4799|nr:low temperature requirement protein A [Thermomonospora amylolytica]
MRPSGSVLRTRDGNGTRVGYFELFFDLVFVFAFTRLSHRLLEHLTPLGTAQALLLLLAIWWAWMYTCWTTNWFDPDHPTVRLMLAAVMLAGLFMSAAVPQAFEERGLWFAAGYVVVQVGRTVYVVAATWRHELGRNFQRVLAWMLPSSVLWIAGGLVDDDKARLALWAAAVAIDYAAPWLGYATPGLGRSRTGDWTIDPRHMAERCHLFIIIALGESLVIIGATLSDAEHPSAGTVAACAVALGASVATWWVYFARTAEGAAERVAESDDPGRLGRSAYTFVHIVMVAGIVVIAVGDELVIAHPGGHVEPGMLATLLGGTALFVLGHALFKKVVFGHFTVARIAAVAVLAVVGVVEWAAHVLTPLALSAAPLAVLVGVALWDARAARELEQTEQTVDLKP